MIPRRETPGAGSWARPLQISGKTAGRRRADSDPAGLEDFARRGRVSFPTMGKKPKDRRGRLTSPSETSSLRLQFVLPGPPFTGIPLYPHVIFPARKIRFRVDSSRATGPLMRRKIPACAILPPRLVPTSRGRGCEVGGAPDEAVPKPTGDGRPKAALRGNRENVRNRGTGGLQRVSPPFVDHDTRRATTRRAASKGETPR